MLYKKAAGDRDPRRSPDPPSPKSRSRRWDKAAKGKRWWQNLTLCKYYAKAVAAVLVSVGLAGLVGSLNWHSISDIYHVVLGLIFAYVGFFV